MASLGIQTGFSFRGALAATAFSSVLSGCYVSRWNDWWDNISPESSSPPPQDAGVPDSSHVAASSYSYVRGRPLRKPDGHVGVDENHDAYVLNGRFYDCRSPVTVRRAPDRNRGNVFEFPTQGCTALNEEGARRAVLDAYLRKENLQTRYPYTVTVGQPVISPQSPAPEEDVLPWTIRPFLENNGDMYVAARRTYYCATEPPLTNRRMRTIRHRGRDLSIISYDIGLSNCLDREWVESVQRSREERRQAATDDEARWARISASKQEHLFLKRSFLITQLAASGLVGLGLFLGVLRRPAILPHKYSPGHAFIFSAAILAIFERSPGHAFVFSAAILAISLFRRNRSSGTAEDADKRLADLEKDLAAKEALQARLPRPSPVLEKRIPEIRAEIEQLKARAGQGVLP